jgi:DNA-binding IclR family transcriptional regulator
VLAALKQLGRHPQGVGLDELARELAVPKSSLHRALAALRRAGLVEHDRRGMYRLSFELIRLAFEYYEAYDERVLLLPALEALVERFAETAHYAHLDGGEIVYVAKVNPTGRQAQMTSQVGGRNPAHCTALGKALLAHELPDAEAAERFVRETGPLARRTARTLVTAAELADELERIRARGCALDEGESEEGIVCIAFPIFLNSRTRPSGAISIAALSHRTPLEVLVAAAGEIRGLIDQHLGPVTR